MPEEWGERPCELGDFFLLQRINGFFPGKKADGQSFLDLYSCSYQGTERKKENLSREETPKTLCQIIRYSWNTIFQASRYENRETWGEIKSKKKFLVFTVR
jgi:hypothetical protein